MGERPVGTDGVSSIGPVGVGGWDLGPEMTEEVVFRI